MRRPIALVVLSTFVVGIVPARAAVPPPKTRAKAYEMLLDTAAAGHRLKVIRTQQDLAATDVADDDTRSVMAGALATGTVAIVTTQQPIISARYRWYGTPWLALGSTYPDFGANQQGFHLNAGHENPNQSEQDLSDDVVEFGLALQGLGNTLATKSPTPASRAIGVAIAGLGLAITMFGLGMKLALATGAPGTRSGSVDADNDPEEPEGIPSITIPDLGQQGAGIGPAGPDGAAPDGPGPSGGGGSTGDSGVGDE